MLISNDPLQIWLLAPWTWVSTASPQAQSQSLEPLHWQHSQKRLLATCPDLQSVPGWCLLRAKCDSSLALWGLLVSENGRWLKYNSRITLQILTRRKVTWSSYEDSGSEERPEFAKICDTPPKHRWNHDREEIWSRSEIQLELEGCTGEREQCK